MPHNLSLARASIMALAMLTSISAGAAESSETTRLSPPIYVVRNLGPNLLGTAALPIRAARFSGSWANAVQDASRNPILLRMVAPARNLPPLQQIAFVQTRVHHNIRWMSDTTQWSQHDYWATANQTLQRGAGDMEDRAIVKMHALRALGFSPDDLFLTLARDVVGGPITVLTVRAGGRYYILDDTGGIPFVADSRRNELQPVLSFGWKGAWVHSAVASTGIRSASRTGR